MRIAAHIARTKQTGIALSTVTRRGEGDFIGYCGLVINRATLDEPEIAYELFSMPRSRPDGPGCGRPCVPGTPLRVLEKLGCHRERVTPDEDGRGDAVWTTRALP